MVVIATHPCKARIQPRLSLSLSLWNLSQSFCSVTATERGPGVSPVPGHLEVRPSATGLLMRQVAARLSGPRPHGDLEFGSGDSGWLGKWTEPPAGTLLLGEGHLLF